MCSLNLKKLAFTRVEAKKKKSIRRIERRHTLKCRLLAKDREIKEKFLKKNSHTINFLTVKSACCQSVSNSSQHPGQSNVKLGDNSCEILNNLQDECASTSFTEKQRTTP